MQTKIVGVSTEHVDNIDLDKLKLFSGRNAGVCYLDGTWDSNKIQNNIKSLKRFYNVINRGHHSIADHVKITVEFEGISKMLAIVLNSLQDYATSEKSGRYMSMRGSSKEECHLYDKWCGIFQKLILEKYSWYDDEFLTKQYRELTGLNDFIVKDGKLYNSGSVDTKNDLFNSALKSANLPSKKIAQENARYMLSVFTRETVMTYTTSLRQWNYIYDWCQKYMSQFTKDKNTMIVKDLNMEASYFDKELYKDISFLSDFIHAELYVSELRDNKDRCFEFLTQQSGATKHHMVGYDLSCYKPDSYTDDTRSADDYFGLVYSTSYPASFVQIAQAERHRTLKYYMYFNQYSKVRDFFVPKILRGTSYEAEWLSDLNSIKDLIPQATKVCIVETGHISDFILKCEERLCGRAQWEIMHQTYVTASKFIDDVDTGKITNKACINYVKKLRGTSDKISTKCQMLSCKERCVWGSQDALIRLV